MAESLERSLLSVLECPVCVNYMSPPIRQCQGGHAFCHECFVRVDTCPICRSAKNLQARCWRLERIHSTLQIPCRNTFAGCTFACKGTNILRHQEACNFRPKPCPFVGYDECTWHGIDSSLGPHLLDKHATNFFPCPSLMLVAQNFRRVRSFYYVYVIIYAFGEFFRVTWDLDETTGMTRWAVYLLGPATRARQFTYKLKFTLPNGSRDRSMACMVFKAPCNAAPQRDGVMFGDYNYFMIHRGQLDKYCKNGNDLHYGVSICFTDPGN